jgi:hypothetical protein
MPSTIKTSNPQKRAELVLVTTMRDKRDAYYGNQYHTQACGTLVQMMDLYKHFTQCNDMDYHYAIVAEGTLDHLFLETNVIEVPNYFPF